MRSAMTWLVAGSMSCGRVGFEPRGNAADAVGSDVLGSDGSVSEPIVVPAGTFMMGCNQAVDTLCGAEELPYHAVTLSAFAIDRTEVTQLAYSACVDAGACTAPAMAYDPIALPDYPLMAPTWDQARVYCEWRGRRLPTEAEWEKAARGDDGRIFPWGNQASTCELAARSGCPGDFQPTGAHPLGASPYGALDMAGNVWEWMNDYYAATYYSTSPAADPPGPATGTLRIVRGGDYSNTDVYLRASSRGANDPALVEPDVGFRCAAPR